MTKHLLLFAGAAALLSASPALAKPDHAKHGKGKHGMSHSQMGHMGYGTGHCPPGLAKQNPQCMPPGKHRKLFSVGQRLPLGYNGYTPYSQIPYDLRRQYGLDDGYRYIHRDNYLYQVDPKTYVVRRILDAIL